MNHLKTIALLAIMAFTLSAFTTDAKDKVESSDNVTYYYYAYGFTGVNSDTYNKLWVTPLLKITIDEDTYDRLDENGLANQFRDHLEAEYNFSSSLSTKGEIFEADTFDQASAMEHYRSTLKRYKSTVKIHDFKYLKERR